MRRVIRVCHDEASFLPRWYKNPLLWYRMRKLFRKMQVNGRVSVMYTPPQTPNLFWRPSALEKKTIDKLKPREYNEK